MTGVEMTLLRRRLAQLGFHCHQFRYPSLRNTPAQNALLLEQFLRDVKADVLHLVAHSLGGLIVLHLFERYQPAQPGRVLMLGTPLKGSATARYLAERRVLRTLLGKSLVNGLLGNVPRWRNNRQIGMIAGSRGWGIGSFLYQQISTPNDGTVAVEETLSEIVDQHLVVPYSHFGMLFAAPVIRAAGYYLQQGSFEELVH